MSATRIRSYASRMLARATKVFPMLSVENLERSRAFYERLLGGVETFRFPGEGSPVYMTLAFGGSELGLGELKPGEQAIHGQPVRPASGHRIELCVYVDDVDRAVIDARESGFTVVFEPTDQPWGERVAYLSDPDGNLVMLAK
jgi:lactoylglutathione lyase